MQQVQQLIKVLEADETMTDGFVDGSTLHHCRLTKEVGEPGKPGDGWFERTFAWLSKCRALLVRYEKKARNYLGLLQFACLLLWFRRYHRLTVLG